MGRGQVRLGLSSSQPNYRMAHGDRVHGDVQERKSHGRQCQRVILSDAITPETNNGLHQALGGGMKENGQLFAIGRHQHEGGASEI